MVFRINPEDFYYLCIRARSNIPDLKGVITYLEKKWEKYAPEFLFEYRFMGLSSFVLAALFALGIAFLTIGYQSIKATIANPIETLRYE